MTTQGYSAVSVAIMAITGRQGLRAGPVKRLSPIETGPWRTAEAARQERKQVKGAINHYDWNDWRHPSLDAASLVSRLKRTAHVLALIDTLIDVQ